MKDARALLLSAGLIAAALAPAVHADESEKAHPALWTIGDEDTTITLFGTVHVMRPDVDWFHGPVRRAFDASDEVVLETLSPEPAEEQALVMRFGVDLSGRGLRSKLEGADRERYDDAMRSIGYPADAFDPFKPWMASMALAIVPMMQAGYSPDSGVDEILNETAERKGKTLVGLETPEQQLGFFDSLDEDLQLGMLNGTVRQMNDIRYDIREMEALWSGGRAEDLGAMVAEMMTGYGDDGTIGDVLLTDRNRRWAEWVDARMAKPGRVFLAVGAGHLAGDGSLLEMLESKGYTVTRVRTKTALAD